ncbi:MAG: hypothetical protein IPI49_16330 [Myxococcales bacterium]|nr:hypothetical protein [Myxococcales bacterium]HRC56516.1 hypothetical protein [Kofleriaceae bacterium]
MEDIETCLAFWVDRLGFVKTVEVPEGDRLGFVILHHGELELMLQSRASLQHDLPAIASGPYRSALFLEVPDLGPIRQALAGWPLIVAGRTTFYGTEEIVVADPAGNHVCFAARKE